VDSEIKVKGVQGPKVDLGHEADLDIEAEPRRGKINMGSKAKHETKTASLVRNAPKTAVDVDGHSMNENMSLWISKPIMAMDTENDSVEEGGEI